MIWKIMHEDLCLTYAILCMKYLFAGCNRLIRSFATDQPVAMPQGLTDYRQLGEAEALLFTAGKLPGSRWVGWWLGEGVLGRAVRGSQPTGGSM